MTKEDFIQFIKDLGFSQTWRSKPDVYSLSTDRVSKNVMSFVDQLNIHFDSEHELVHLSLSTITSHMTSGKNFGNFSLKTFGDKGDFQLEIFLSFIVGSFNKAPDGIIQLMRDRKINNILK